VSVRLTSPRRLRGAVPPVGTLPLDAGWFQTGQFCTGPWSWAELCARGVLASWYAWSLRLVRGTTGLGRRRSSCGGDAERAVVVIVVNPAPWHSDLDGWMQSTRVELRRHAGDAVMADGLTWTIGSSQRGSVTTWVRAAGSAWASTSLSTLGNGMNHGQWCKVAKARVSLPPSAHNIGILVASTLKTLKRSSGPFPDRSRFVLRHQSVPVGGRCSWRSPQRCRHAGDINDGEVMFAWIRKP